MASASASGCSCGACSAPKPDPRKENRRDTKIKVNSADPGWVKTDMGGPDAPMELSEGGKTSVYLATLPADGPTSGFFLGEQPFPW